MNLQEIEFLAGLMKQNDLTLLSVEQNDLKIKLERGCAATPMVVQSVATPVAAPAMVAAPAPVAAEAAAVGAAPQEDCVAITSPMVGVFYSSPSPDAQPFVTIGSAVQKGDVLCVIEAMKLMNEVVAEEDGVIADICVQNGQVAEYGQPLFKIKKG